MLSQMGDRREVPYATHDRACCRRCRVFTPFLHVIIMSGVLCQFLAPRSLQRLGVHNVPNRMDWNTVTNPRRCEFIAPTNIFATKMGLISKRLFLVS